MNSIVTIIMSGAMLLATFIAPIHLVAPTATTLFVMPYKVTTTSNPDSNPASGAVNLKIDKVLFYDDTATDRGKRLEFDLYINRIDGEDLQEPENSNSELYTSELPKRLQPQTMYVSDVNDLDAESGSSCDIPRFPHRCSVSFGANENSSALEYKFLVKTTFKDGKFAFEEITVPTPKVLQNPEITFPVITPAQNSKLVMKFKDVGAKHYEASVNLCMPYGNDGINPCLDGTTYYLEKKNGAWVITRQDDLSKATLQVVNGYIEISSDFNIAYQESVEYNVKAYSSDTLKDGTPTYAESHAFKSFPKI